MKREIQMQENYRRLQPLKKEKYPRQEPFAEYLKSGLFSLFYKSEEMISHYKKEGFIEAVAALHLRLVKRHKLEVFEGGKDERLSHILLGVDLWFLRYMERYDGLEGFEEPGRIEYPFSYVFEIKRQLITAYRKDLRRWQREPNSYHFYRCIKECEDYEMFEKLVVCTETEELLGRGMIIDGNDAFLFSEEEAASFAKRIEKYRSHTAQHVLQIFVGFVNLNVPEWALHWRLEKVTVSRE